MGNVIGVLTWQKRKNVGKGLIQAVIADGRGLRSVEQMVSLLRIITPLLKPDQMKSDNESMYQDDIDNELNWVAKLVHLYDNEDTDVMFFMFNITSKYFSQAEKSRIENTLSSLVFATFKLLKQVYGEEFAQELESVVSANANSTQTAEAAKESKEENTGELEVAVNNMNVSEDGDENKKDTDNDANPEDGEISKETTENEAVTEMNGSEGGETGPETTDKSDSSNDIKNIETEQAETEFVDVLEPKEVPTEASLFEDSESKTENLPSAPLLFNKSANCRKIFLFLQQVISPITPVNPGLAYQLFLQSATMASSFALPCVPVDFNSISYEFLIQAFNVYSNDITESKAQMNAMTQMVGTLLSCRSFSPAEFGALVTKAAQYSARMLKKPDQCTMVTLCSHLFYTGDDNDPNAYRHPQRVLECLQRALKIADACTTASASNVYLFIDILDHYVFYFEREAPLITDRFVSGLIALINEHLAGSTDQDALVHSQQIVKYVQAKKLSDKKFARIIC